jgi:hypothetical protein
MLRTFNVRCTITTEKLWHCYRSPIVTQMNCAADDRADVEGNAQDGPVVRLSFASLFDALGR